MDDVYELVNNPHVQLADQVNSVEAKVDNVSSSLARYRDPPAFVRKDEVDRAS